MELAATGILAMTGVKVLTNLENAKDALEKLILGLNALESHDYDVTIFEKAALYTEAAILKFMEVTETPERKLND